MRAGRLDRTIRIQRLTREIGDAGTVAESWTDLATVRAELLTPVTTEAATGYGEADDATVGFRIRYLADLTTADRVAAGEVVFNIVAIEESGRRRSLELRCKRVHL
jgi:SPP1 family predicted phage head-tail adaptor